MSAEEEAAHGYLESFTARRELANFIGQRAFVFRDNKRFREAAETFAVADRLTTQNKTYWHCLWQLVTEWKAHLQSQYPPRFPRWFTVDRPPGGHRWPWLPEELEREITCLHAIESCLTDPKHDEWWWRPLRENRPPLREVPTRITVNYESLLRNP